MDIKKQIKAAAALAGVSLSELAHRIGTSPAALNNRMNTGKFTRAELERIAQALDCEYVSFFEFKDGTRI